MCTIFFVERTNAVPFQNTFLNTYYQPDSVRGYKSYAPEGWVKLYKLQAEKYETSSC